VAQTPIRTGAALVALIVAAIMGTMIIFAEALVRLVARINEARPGRRHRP